MSSMLEQAIVDAAALREAAMKSAEASLIEKYKDEFQQTINKLIEQEEVTPPAPPTEMSPEAAAANAEDATGPVVTDEPEMPTDPAGTLPLTPKNDVFKKVKTAFFDLDGSDDELITINFDGLTGKPGVDTSMSAAGGQNSAAPAPMMENIDLDEELELELEAYDMNGGNGSHGGHSAGVDLEENYGADLEEEGIVIKIGSGSDDSEEELELIDDSEEEFDEYEMELEEAEQEPSSPVVDPNSANLKKRAADLEMQAAGAKGMAARLDAKAQTDAAQKNNNPVSEEIELSEEELNELEEALRVEMENVSNGYMGTHKKEEREAKAVAYAAARDDKKKERREEYAEKIADLQENLKKSEKENIELIKLVNTLKEQVQKINISNAKLLYTNKVLGDASLNERQKNHVVENISRAVSVSQAKTIYETLQSTVESIKEKTPKSLSEAINRNSSPFLVRKQPANTNDVFTERMKALAGLKSVD